MTRTILIRIAVWCTLSAPMCLAGPAAVPTSVATPRPAIGTSGNGTTAHKGIARPASTTAPVYNYVFSGFDDSGPASEKLRIAYSQDGISWTNASDVYTAPAGNGVRDPSIMCLGGVYYVAYTAANSGNAPYFQICQSTDLVNWSYLCNVDTSFAGEGTYTWAPDWFLDRDGTVYIFLSRELPDGSWRIYWTKAKGLDLTSWTAVQPLGGEMAARGAIDPHVVRNGDFYYLFYRNYGSSGNTDCIEMARGTSPVSFSLYETGDWAGFGSPREGPSVVHLGGLHWGIYYNNLSVYGDLNYYSESTDGLATWSTPVATNISGHGTILPLTSSASDPFDAFLFRYGLTDVDPQVDFDHDGVSDLSEFLLCGNPTLSDPTILPIAIHSISGGVESLTYSFYSTASPGAATWTVEMSPDLVTWTPVIAGKNGATISTTPYDDARNLNVVTVPGLTGGRLSGRLRVTQPAATSP